MHHGGEGCDGENVTSHFNGALFGLAIHFINALGMRHGTEVPDVSQDFTRAGTQQLGQFAIVIPGAGYGAFVNCSLCRAELRAFGRHVGLGFVEPHVALALLFGIIERMRVEKRPDELAADVFEAEFEMGVLENGVVSAIKSGRANIDALLFGDFFGRNDARGIAGSRGGDGGVVRMREGIAQRDSRRGGFHGLIRLRHGGCG